MRFMQVSDLYLLLVIALIKVLSWSPSLRVKEICVKAISLTAYHLSRDKRRRIAENLSKAFGATLSEEQ